MYTYFSLLSRNVALSEFTEHRGMDFIVDYAVPRNPRRECNGNLNGTTGIICRKANGTDSLAPCRVKITELRASSVSLLWPREKGFSHDSSAARARSEQANAPRTGGAPRGGKKSAGTRGENVKSSKAERAYRARPRGTGRWRRIERRRGARLELAAARARNAPRGD